MRSIYPTEFKACLRSFVERRYADCISEVMALLNEHETLELNQLMWVCAQRLGANEAISSMWRQLQGALVGDDWPAVAVLGATIGQVSIASFAERTNDTNWLARAHYAVGAHHLTTWLLGEEDSSGLSLRCARDHFERCLSFDADVLDRSLAAAELEALPQATSSTVRQADIDELERLSTAPATPILSTEAAARQLQATQYALKTFGPGHGLYWQSLLDLGWAYLAGNQLQEATNSFTSALNVCSTHRAACHPTCGLALAGLASTAMQRGHHNEAIRDLKVAYSVLCRALGDEHDSALKVLVDLGRVHTTMGEYREAHRYFERALRHLAPDNPYRLMALNGTAVAFASEGRYDRARVILDDLIRAIEGVPEGARCAVQCNAGWLSCRLGDLEKGSRLMAEAARNATSQLHHDLPLILINSADMLSKGGMSAEAVQLCEQALHLMREAGRHQHETYRTGLAFMSHILLRGGRRAEAFQYLGEAVRLTREVSDSPAGALGTSLLSMAVAQRAAGHMSEAVQLSEEAWKILQAAWGTSHPDMAEALVNMAGIHAAAGDLPRARKFLSQMIEEPLLGILDVLAVLAERERIHYVAKIRACVDAMVSLARRSDNCDDASAALMAVQRVKGLSLQFASLLHARTIGTDQPVVAQQLAELTEVKTELGELLRPTIDEQDNGQTKARVERLRDERDRLEADLSRGSPSLAEEARRCAASLEAIRTALPADAVLVEFVVVADFDLAAASVGESRGEFTDYYVAFVLHSDAQRPVACIDLGPTETIDQLIVEFHQDVAGGRLSTPRLGDDGEWALPGTRLRELVIDPLAPSLRDKARVMIAPDGNLQLLPFCVLPSKGGRRLIDELHFLYVDVARDVIRHGEPVRAAQGAPVVVADPDFDLGLPSRGSGRGLRPLIGARLEGLAVARALGVTAIFGADATKAAVARVRSPSVLHIATHGGFTRRHLPIAEPTCVRASVLVSITNELEEIELQASERAADSYLALAGHNAAARDGRLGGEIEDGILSAEDVTSIELSGTELVVLSACQTGFGYVLNGEGVFGLRRAFAMAGARTILISLWSVPDMATLRIMEEFYSQVIRGADRCDALRRAQLKVRGMPGMQDPIYWGGFVCVGDPGPMECARTL